MRDDSKERQAWTAKNTTVFGDNRVRDDAAYVPWRDSVREIVIMFKEPQLQELYEYFGPVCQDIWCFNIPESNQEREKIRIPALDWAINLVNGVVDAVTNEEYPMDIAFPVGTKVKRKGEDTTNVIVKYGIVTINKFWLMRSNLGSSPFQDLKIPEYFNTEMMERFASQVQLDWFDKDGNKIAVSWANPETLESL
jgi:hypothetical protein